LTFYSTGGVGFQRASRLQCWPVEFDSVTKKKRVKAGDVVKLPKRNLAAKAARNQKAGAMKDRREARKGARNTMREAMEEAE
jgi:hypothetical protein